MGEHVTEHEQADSSDVVSVRREYLLDAVLWSKGDRIAAGSHFEVVCREEGSQIWHRAKGFKYMYVTQRAKTYLLIIFNDKTVKRKSKDIVLEILAIQFSMNWAYCNERLIKIINLYFYIKEIIKIYDIFYIFLQDNKFCEKLYVRILLIQFIFNLFAFYCFSKSFQFLSKILFSIHFFKIHNVK